MSELIVLTVLWLSSSWVFSRWHAPTNAWRPKYPDTAAGILFASSWLANTIDIITNSALPSVVNTPAMTWFLAFLILGGGYAVAIIVFAKFRVMVYKWTHD